jgi:hypothetical protein
MQNKISSNDIENDDLDINTVEIDHKNLITRLKEIKETITLLEKTVSR